MSHHRPYQLKSPSTATPPLPAGIDPAAFLARQAAMIEAGTHPMIAEKLALDAAQNQVLRERHPKFVAAGEPVVSTVTSD